MYLFKGSDYVFYGMVQISSPEYVIYTPYIFTMYSTISIDNLQNVLFIIQV